ncbi:MAG: O-antigen ligase C-terminal domain-containing protein [Ramlibacter sp.]|nr:O-antigen ligase C-terminal domain-containing protein [Ramlibacter sp.]
MFRAFLPVAKTPPWGRFSLGNVIVSVSVPMLLTLGWLTTEHFPPWVSWHAEVAAFFSAILLAWAGVFSWFQRTRGAPLCVPTMVVPFVLLGCIAIVQALLGLVTFWGDAIVFGIYASLCATCLLTGFNAFRHQEGFHERRPAQDRLVQVVATALVTGSLVSAFIALAQVFELWEGVGWIVRMPSLRRPGANLAQTNQLSTLLLMGIVSVIYLRLNARLSGLAVTFMLVLLGVGVATTESRAGALSVLVLFVWWQFRRPLIASHVSVATGPAFVALFAGAFVGWPHLLEAMQILEAGVSSRIDPGSLRFQVWPQLIEAVGLHPWAGWGVLGVSKAHNAVVHAYSLSEPYSYSHNLFLDLALWFGLPIAVVVILLGGAWLIRRIRTATTPTSWFCLAVALPLGVHSMLEFPYAYGYFLVPVMLLMGVLQASAVPAKGFKLDFRLAVGLLLTLTVLAALSVVEYLEAEEDFRVVRFEALSIGTTPASHHQPHPFLLSQLDALLSGSRIELRAGMAPDDIEKLRNLALRYPWSATQYRYVLALGLNGNQLEAARQLKVIRAQRGEKLYQQLRNNIKELSQTRYPQLSSLQLP